MEVEFVAITSTLVDAEGTNVCVCVMAGKNNTDKVSKLVSSELAEISVRIAD